MDGVEDEISQLRDAEFTVLLPTMALLSCANSRAAELGGGFELTSSGLQLRWPSEVIQGFGLSPTTAKSINGSPEVTKVYFEPVVADGPSYWSELFSSDAPALVVCYEVSGDNPPYIASAEEHWIHWPWHVSEQERVAACEAAVAAHEKLAEGADWLALAMKASNVGPRSVLFSGVKHYLEQFGLGPFVGNGHNRSAR